MQFVSTISSLLCVSHETGSTKCESERDLTTGEIPIHSRKEIEVLLVTPEIGHNIEKLRKNLSFSLYYNNDNRTSTFTIMNFILLSREYYTHNDDITFFGRNFETGSP